MIARIRGTLIQKSLAQCIVDVNGVGYRVVISLPTFYELPEIDQPVILHIHTNVREDAINLFGFHTEEDREIFQLMISVSGIGPKLAINILSGIAAQELIQAIIQGDVKRLTGIPGVGKKTAERMVLELKDKVTKLVRESVKMGAFAPKADEHIKDDALSALVNLGYRANMVNDVIDGIMSKAPAPLSLDQLLKQTLRILAG